MISKSSQPDNFEVSREDLYEQVWAKPMSRLADTYNVSGSYLARVCEALNVPRPPTGYWQKKAVGKAPRQPILPPAQPGDQLSWSKAKPIAHKSARFNRRPKKPKEKQYTKGKHPLLVGVESHFLKTRKMEEDEFLRPYKKLLPDIVTSADRLKYAIETADEIYKAFEARGHRVIFATPDQNMQRASIEEREDPSGDRKYGRYSMGTIWSPHRPTITFVGGVPFGLALCEMTERATMRYVNGKYVRENDALKRAYGSRRFASTWTTEQDIPCGRFKLTAYSPVNGVEWVESWQENSKKPLNAMLKAIVRKLEGAESTVRELTTKAEEEAAQRRRDWEESRERWRRDEDRRRVEQAETDSRKQLSNIMEKWQLAISTELFFQEAEKRALGHDDERKEAILSRLEAARTMLGSVDPLEFLEDWKAPSEIYTPKYNED